MKRRTNKKQSKNKKSIFSIIFRVILIVSAIFLILSYLSVYINPAKIWLPSIFGIYFIPILIINFILLLIVIVRRSSYLWISVATILPSILFLNYYYKSEENKYETNENQIKIITYNVGRFFSHKQDISSYECVTNITKFIEQENPDIICFQEFNIKDTADIKMIFTEYKYYQYHLFKSSTKDFFGNITFSKYPMVGGGKLTFKRSTNLSLFSDIDIKNKVIRVYNNHLESYNISLKSFINRMNNREYNKASGELKHAYDKIILTNKKRAEQVDAIVQNIKNVSNSIICGDLNDTPMSYTFNQLKKNHKDTFSEAGNGFGATYSTFWPLLRIDFILTPPEFEIVEHRTPQIKWSDHYPVISKFNI